MTRQPREIGMLFAAPMVRAILNGTKTVTRRPMKHQPVLHDFGVGGVGPELAFVPPALMPGYLAISIRAAGEMRGAMRAPVQPGDRIYVREAFRVVSISRDRGNLVEVDYRSDGEHRTYLVSGDQLRGLVPAPKTPGVFWTATERSFRCRPAMHMPKWASRTWLDVVSVTVERVKYITEDDARREGVVPLGSVAQEQRIIGSDRTHGTHPHTLAFACAWDGIYTGSWQRNDWVWRIEWAPIGGAK